MEDSFQGFQQVNRRNTIRHPKSSKVPPPKGNPLWILLEEVFDSLIYQPNMETKDSQGEHSSPPTHTKNHTQKITMFLCDVVSNMDKQNTERSNKHTHGIPKSPYDQIKGMASQSSSSSKTDDEAKSNSHVQTPHEKDPHMEFFQQWD
ncbi:hypothetical protein L7F22_057883 [Adiantum nelumboides]|nr:hypothetical protein [Adiantum nelumboides]